MLEKMQVHVSLTYYKQMTQEMLYEAPSGVLPCIKYSEFFLIYMYYYFGDHIGG